MRCMSKLKALREAIAADVHDGDEVYQLNIQFFPVTEEV